MPETDPESPPSNVTVSLKSENDIELPWLKELTAIGFEDDAQIATCDAKLIKRDRIRPSFWQDMEEPSQGTRDLAFGLFDRYGRVSRKYTDPGFRQGSGVWGCELDHGEILFFEKLAVDSRCRRRGVGTQLVQAVLDNIRANIGQNGYIVMVWPGILTQEVARRDGDEAKRVYLATSRRFWRSLGFRRIGTSSWFAFTDDEGHPSRSLDVSEEWDPPQDTGFYTAISEPVQGVIDHVLRAPASTPEDLRQLDQVVPDSAEDGRWFATNEHGNTVLHMAAMKGNLDLIKYLIARCPDLATARNREGDTPLEALQSSMELLRTRSSYMEMVEVVSDRFKGFDQSTIACVEFLSRGKEVFDLTQLSREEISRISSATDSQARTIHPEADAICHALRLKYGCTCGQCMGGFLSPRMKHKLIEETLGRRDEDRTIGWDNDDWLEEGRHMLTGRFVKCLKKGMIPNENNILSSVSDKERPTLEAFLEEGGTVSSIGTTIFQRMLDSEDWQLALSQTDQETATGRILPECRNDLELGFVSGMCGYKRVSPGRKYFHDEEREEDDDDEDFY
ncbi:hypothetical protein PG993_002356 [Apiospora rasikravindrae]|uniref:N-acetyltransferase domain-containing protein n=1 Tax=Apiospora rasikravindrae TaxID=990691 RepID=A0ABR1TWD7_9PEZI